MGDIVGRLFREFAITLSVTILVSAVVSLTLTPMMCSRLLKAQTRSRPKALSIEATEHVWKGVIDFYAQHAAMGSGASEPLLLWPPRPSC